MTLITFHNGQPVLRDGKIGAEQGCCCGGSTGRCCACTQYASAFYDFLSNAGPQDADIIGLRCYCDAADRGAFYDLLMAEIDERISHAAQVLGDNGWICISSQREIFSDFVPPAQAIEDGCLPPNACPDQNEVYRISPTWWLVYATCCGTIDTSAEPLDIWGDNPPANPLASEAVIYPCVGPYVYDICIDNVAQQDCCGKFFPGETCAAPSESCEETEYVGDERNPLP